VAGTDLGRCLSVSLAVRLAVCLLAVCLLAVCLLAVCLLAVCLLAVCLVVRLICQAGAMLLRACAAPAVPAPSPAMRRRV
jgi:hypothetical protein